jgi:hypothetical protein
MILCEVQDDLFWFINDSETSYFMQDINSDFRSISLTYFGTTTLTTVGLGDLHPKSNFERGICTILMITGVAMFS